MYPFSKANYTLKYTFNFNWVLINGVSGNCLSCPINIRYSKQNESTDYVKTFIK